MFLWCKICEKGIFYILIGHFNSVSLWLVSLVMLIGDILYTSFFPHFKLVVLLSSIFKCWLTGSYFSILAEGISLLLEHLTAFSTIVFIYNI